jgi:osmotically-inducible protein OsmY
LNVRAIRVVLFVFLLVSALPVLSAADKPVPDDLLYDEVRRRLVNDPDVKGAELEVEVSSGVVTVKGIVEREKARSKAEKVIKKVRGVKSVVNQLKVAPKTAVPR